MALSARGFMVGEEAVTLDIVPLLRCMSDLGRLEDTMYLSMFAMEEAKHTEMFRRWFDAVGLDPSSLDDLVRAQQEAIGQRGQGVFDGALTKVMRRLDTDRSPQAILDATLIYNQLVEGVAAIAGYHRWDWVFRRLGKLAGLEAGIKLTQRDERRHIAYGTYLGRRILAENPDLWEWAEQRWEKLTAGFGGGYGAASTQAREQRAALGYDDEYRQRLIKRGSRPSPWRAPWTPTRCRPVPSRPSSPKNSSTSTEHYSAATAARPDRTARGVPCVTVP